MPKPMPPDDPDTGAALAAWEEGQGASAPDHADPTCRTLRRTFLHHPDVQALDAAIAAAQADGQALEAHRVDRIPAHRSQPGGCAGSVCQPSEL